VHLTANTIHNIGEPYGSGAQHGVAIYLRGYFAISNLTGEVSNNNVTGYQKGGIVANGKGVKAKITGNKVVGFGHVNFISQNGIQIGYGARPTEVTGNEVHANSYIGTPGDGSASAGLLVVGGPFYGLCPDGITCPYTTNQNIGNNILFNNDVALFSFNAQVGGLTTSPTATQVVMYLNLATSDACYNNSYQAGVSDLGNTDYMLFNYIAAGGGYDPPCGVHYDTSGSITPFVAPFPGTTLTEAEAPASSPAARPSVVPYPF
jgi:hypothetical protein